MSSNEATDGKQGRDTLPASGFRLGPGDVLGRKYRIEAQIAEGGMGVVLRALHLDLGCQVAIKLIRPEYAANEEVVARLLSEARIAASLRSKHVNRVLDVGRTDAGIPYLVLEYMEGSDLCNYLTRCGRLPVAEAVDHVLAACEALAEAHAVGIVHRDLKPENLFLSEDADGAFVLKVFDFGISKAPPTREPARTLTGPGAVVGSPCYMSPEQISGALVDGRSDIWALGALLYELCTGELLFGAANMTETFSLILDPDRVLPALELGPPSEHLRRVLVKCLQHSADQRYQTVVELALALAPLGADPLQAARVAKVAAAARARAIGRTDDASLGSVTPLVLTTSQLDIEVVDGAQRRSRWRWLAPAFAAAAVPLLIAVYFMEGTGRRREATPWRPTAVPASAAARPAAPTPVKAVDVDNAAVDVEPPEAASVAVSPRDERGSTLPISANAPRVVQPRPRPVVSWHPSTLPVARPTIPAVVTQPVATPAAITPPPPPSAPPKPASAAVGSQRTAATDAWDPNLFGGRR